MFRADFYVLHACMMYIMHRTLRSHDSGIYRGPGITKTVAFFTISNYIIVTIEKTDFPHISLHSENDSIRFAIYDKYPIKNFLNFKICLPNVRKMIILAYCFYTRTQKSRNLLKNRSFY